MRLQLIAPDEPPRSLSVDAPYATHALAPGVCPHCKTAPFYVAGTGVSIASDDRAYEAGAVALCCKRRVGVIRAEVSTLFGVTEDEQVTAGPWKVF